jgi:cob(I)alamin adenosyltransferase
MQKGLLILYTGHGKGKTTAAFGMAYRAMGRGWRVAVVQYIKGKWMTGERLFSKEMDRLELHVMGEGFTWESEDISRDQAAASRAWAQSVELIQSGDYPLVDGWISNKCERRWPQDLSL